MLATRRRVLTLVPLAIVLAACSGGRATHGTQPVSQPAASTPSSVGAPQPSGTKTVNDHVYLPLG